MLQVGKNKQVKMSWRRQINESGVHVKSLKIICQEPDNKLIGYYNSGGGYGTDKWMN